jgi:hypothetical protein
MSASHSSRTRLKIGIAVSLVVCLLDAFSSRVLAQTPASYALVIGIDDYSRSPGVDGIYGPVNDARDVAQILMTRLGVPKANLTLLLNPEATHTRVQAAFKALANRIGGGSLVYIYYSGHGSTMPDPGDPSGTDETWVTYGSRDSSSTGLDQLDVRDKEINYWLQPIYAKTPNLIFVSDSCHSATAARGDRIPAGARAAFTDKRFVGEDKDFPGQGLLKRYPTIPLPNGKPSLPGIRIGAARDTESSIELDSESGGLCSPVRKEKCRGVFTRAWVTALQRAGRADRWQAVFDRTFTWVTTQRKDAQRPQIEGDATKCVFTQCHGPAQKLYSVTSVAADKHTATLAAGLLDGVTSGSVFEAVAQSTPAGPAAVAQLKIIDPQLFSSTASVLNGSVEVGEALQEKSHVYSFAPVALLVTGDDPDTPSNKALITRLRAGLKDLSGFELVDDRAKADWLIYVIRPRRDAKGKYIYSSRQRLPDASPTDPPEVWIISPQEELLHPNAVSSLSDPEAGLTHLQANLDKFAWTRQLLSLETSHRSPPLQAQVTVHRPDARCHSHCEYLPDDTSHQKPLDNLGTYDLSALSQELAAAKKTRLQQDDMMTFHLQRNKDKDLWYVYVFDIGSDGTVGRVVPVDYSNEDEARLGGGAVWDKGLDQVVHFTEPGIEAIKIIVSTRPIDPRLIEQPVGYTKGDLNPLEHLLQTASLGRRAVENHDPGDWSTSAASFEVSAGAVR